MRGAWISDENHAGALTRTASNTGRRSWTIEHVPSERFYLAHTAAKLLDAYDFLVLPLSLPRYWSLRLPILANRISSDTRLILWSRTDADPTSLGRFFDAAFGRDTLLINILERAEKPPTRERDPRSTDTLLEAIVNTSTALRTEIRMQNDRFGAKELYAYTLEAIEQEEPSSTPPPLRPSLPAPGEEPSGAYPCIEPSGRTAPPVPVSLSPQRPRLFIGSSTEGLPVAETLQCNLDHHAEVTVWTQGVFTPAQGSLASLVQRARAADFAVLVLSADDLVRKREREVISPRDNVIFELGLFMGALGPERVFIVHSREQRPELPSDLAGITALTYAPHSDGNLHSALGASCTAMRQAMLRLGACTHSPD